MSQFGGDTVFKALTRPQLLLGVPYGFVIANGIVVAELFLIFKSFWVIAVALIAHAVAAAACLREPRVIDLWLVKIRRTPRIRNYAIWRCNSYRP